MAMVNLETTPKWQDNSLNIRLVRIKRESTLPLLVLIYLVLMYRSCVSEVWISDLCNGHDCAFLFCKLNWKELKGLNFIKKLPLIYTKRTEVQNWPVSGELLPCANRLCKVPEMLQWTVLQSGLSGMSMCSKLSWTASRLCNLEAINISVAFFHWRGLNLE